MNAVPPDRQGPARRDDPHEQYVQLVVGHALDALEPDEEQLLLRHLAGCARCSRDLANHRESLAELAHATDPVEPPASLWDGIREQVLARDPGAFSTTHAPLVAPSPTVPDELAARREARGRRSGRALVSVAAAAVAAAVGLGAWNVVLQGDRDAQVQARSSLAAAVAALEAGPSRTVPLADKEGRALAVAVLQEDRLSLVLEGLPANDATDSTYVVWGQTGAGQPGALAAFDVDDGGVAVVRDLALPAGPTPEMLLITREAGRTAPSSTTQPVLASGRA